MEAFPTEEVNAAVIAAFACKYAGEPHTADTLVDVSEKVDSDFEYDAPSQPYKEDSQDYDVSMLPALEKERDDAAVEYEKEKKRKEDEKKKKLLKPSGGIAKKNAKKKK